MRVSYVFRISAVMVSGSFSAKVMSVKFGNRFDFVMMIHPFVIYFLHSQILKKFIGGSVFYAQR